MRKYYYLSVFVLVSMLFSKGVFYLDYACYDRERLEKTKVDIYISVPIQSLEFDKSLTSVFAIKLYVYDGEKLIAEDKWKQKYTLKTEADKFTGVEIPALSTMYLDPGYYRLLAKVEDMNSKNVETIDIPQSSKKFVVAKFTDKFSVSTIQLASKIITNDVIKDSEFYKQGVVVLPNPSKVFGTRRPFLFYFTEVYGLKTGNKVDYNWYITDNEGIKVKEGKYQSKDSPSKAIVLADRLPIQNLKTGVYNFNLEVSKNGSTLESSNNFYIYRTLDFREKAEMKFEDISNAIEVLSERSIEIELKKIDRDKNIDDLDVEAKRNILLDYWGGDRSKEKFEYFSKLANEDYSSSVEVLSDKNLLDEFEQVYSVLDKKEKSLADKLNNTGRVNFLKRYWDRKENDDPDAREKFLYLISIANKDYSTGKKQGWDTDRGRILITHGSPDKIDKETYSTDTQDHEIWHYFNGNYTFVFADTHGFGEFTLIHSDFTGEKNDPNWEDKIKKEAY
ncbi:MAG: GWxTD domain-containing protein [Candidatus Delongbacteria bacterium]|jgi:GWxTD domain-containing protein|nr:GWxTD domain-containing protein [Candidatus Delongbacteria bacterium]